MNVWNSDNILEINDCNLNPTYFFDENLAQIQTVDITFHYSQFFELFLIANKPCIVKNVSLNWPCTKKWIRNKTLDVNYFKSHYSNIEVPISNCERREFNVQKKCCMKLFEFLDYWEVYNRESKERDSLYLKDWHFVKEFPEEEIYRVPCFFASDWLNEYYDKNKQLNDDYRFVYIGPKGSWTPFHADVFTSYSWSVNISGRKKWLLIPPKKEEYFRDPLRNLNYDIDLTKINQKSCEEKFAFFEIIQEEGEGLFVPSGWHHQVWNLEDTISINHNWINGCNIYFVWESLKKHLDEVMREISDCKEMENWISQCQTVLNASFGMNYHFFYSFLVETAKSRIEALKSGKSISVFGNWNFGDNHMKFDLKQILKILKLMEEDDSFSEISVFDSALNHSLEFLDRLNNL